MFFHNHFIYRFYKFTTELFLKRDRDSNTVREGVGKEKIWNNIKNSGEVSVIVRPWEEAEDRKTMRMLQRKILVIINRELFVFWQQ